MPNPTLLEKHPLLVHLESDQLARIAQAGEVESYNPNEQIVVEGSLGDALFLILSGQVAVHRGPQTFATLGGGEFFGEMSLVEPAPRSATVDVDAGDVLVPAAARRAPPADRDRSARVVGAARAGRQDAVGSAAPREPDAVERRHARRLARRLDGLMADLVDGERVPVQGSTSTYTLERKGAIRSCTCPAWRNQHAPIEQRTCKHLRAYIGEDFESARVGSAAPALRIPPRPAWVPQARREDREVRLRRRAALGAAVESFPVVYDKMLEVYQLRMPRHLAYAAGWWLGLTRAERAEAWGYVGTGLAGVTEWFEGDNLTRATIDGLDGRLHYRFRREPPEMVTVFGGNSDGSHWGLWYDDPAELPRTISHNWARDSSETSACQPTLLMTLRHEMLGRDALDPNYCHLGTIVDWLDEVLAQELEAHRAEQISRFVPRAEILGGIGPWVAGWTAPAELGTMWTRQELYAARAPIVDDWIAAARAAIATEPGRALLLGRELHWFDGDPYRAVSGELLVTAYRALGRDALAEIARLHHAHRNLGNVGVYVENERRSSSDDLITTDVATLRARLAESLAGVEDAQLYHLEQLAFWRDYGETSYAEQRAQHRAALACLFELGRVGGNVLEAAYKSGDVEVRTGALANINLAWRSERGRTVLHVACRAAWVDGVRALLERGANPGIRDVDKQLAYDAVRDAWEDHRSEAAAIYELLRVHDGAPEPAKPAPVAAATWTAGTRVVHAKFGEGVITAVTGKGDDAKLVIAFATCGAKTLLAKFVSRP